MTQVDKAIRIPSSVSSSSWPRPFVTLEFTISFSLPHSYAKFAPKNEILLSSNCKLTTLCLIHIRCYTSLTTGAVTAMFSDAITAVVHMKLYHFKILNKFILVLNFTNGIFHLYFQHLNTSNLCCKKEPQTYT